MLGQAVLLDPPASGTVRALHEAAVGPDVPGSPGTRGTTADPPSVGPGHSGGGPAQATGDPMPARVSRLLLPVSTRGRRSVQLMPSSRSDVMAAVVSWNYVYMASREPVLPAPSLAGDNWPRRYGADPAALESLSLPTSVPLGALRRRHRLTCRS